MGPHQGRAEGEENLCRSSEYAGHPRNAVGSSGVVLGRRVAARGRCSPQTQPFPVTGSGGLEQACGAGHHPAARARPGWVPAARATAALRDSPSAEPWLEQPRWGSGPWLFPCVAVPGPPGRRSAGRGAACCPSAADVGAAGVRVGSAGVF